MSLKKKAASLLDIRPGEGATIWSLFLFSFLLGLSSLFFETTSNALFLATVGASSIPLIYLVSAVVLVLSGLVFSRLQARITPPRLLTGELIFLFISIAAFFAALAAFPRSRGIALGLMVWKEALFTLSQLVFWALAGMLLNVRQGKRLFGLVSTGFVLADITGGFTAGAVVKTFGIAALLVLSAAGAALSLVLFRRTVCRFTDRLRPEDQEEEETGSSKSAASLFRDRYVRVFFAVAALSVLGFYLVDYMFMKQVEIRFPDELPLAGFFGLYYAALGLVNLLGSLFVSGRLLSRFGVGFGIIVLPAFLVLGMGSVVLTLAVPGLTGFLFWAIVVAKIGHEFFLASILTPAGQILYQAVPSGQRLRVQTLRESVIEPVAMGASGILLLALISLLGLSLAHLVVIVFAILVPWIILGIVLKKRYVAGLIAALRRRRLRGATLSLDDASSLAVLKKGLESPHPYEVISCLNMLEEMGHRDLPKFFVSLLKHGSAEIRIEALARIGRARIETARPAVRERIRGDASPAVRAAALRTFFELDGPAAAEEALPFLDDSDPEIRAAAIAGLIGGGGDLAPEAASRIERLAESPSAVERVFAARVAGEAKAGILGLPLGRLLQDEDAEVRKAALAAEGLARDARLWGTVIENLNDPRFRRSAFSALTSGGEAAGPFLRAAYAESGRKTGFRTLIVRILAKSTGPAATEFLAGQADVPDQELAYQILRALRGRAYEPPPDRRPEFEETIRRQAAAAAWALDRERALGGSEAFAYLKTALANGFRQIVKRVLLLLSFLHDAEAVMQASHHLVFETSSTNVARSLEVLDSLIPRELKPWVFPLIDGLPAEERLRLLAKVAPPPGAGPEAAVLKEISERAGLWGDLWLEACVLYAVGSAKVDRAREILEKAVTSREPIVRETAVWALWKLDPEGLARRAEEAPDDPESSWAAIARGLLTQNRGTAGPFLLFEKVILLKNTVLFSETREDAVALIAGALEVNTAGAGETIIREGEPGDRMFLLVRGRVRISTRSGLSLALGAGDIFGEFALVDDAPRTATVAVTDEATLFAVPRDVFREILSDRTEVAFDFIRVMARRLRQKLAAKHALLRERAIPPAPPPAAEETPDFETWLPVEQMLFVGSVPLFSGLSEPALREIAGALKKVRAKAGEKIIEKGEIGTSLFIVVAGCLRVHDENRTLIYLDRGQIVGELAVLDREVRMASVTAETDTQLFRLDQDAFFETMAEQPDMASAVMSEMARRVREEQDLMSRLSSL